MKIQIKQKILEKILDFDKQGKVIEIITPRQIL